jgi:hypothetical protein
VSATVIDRNPGRRKAWISKSTHGNAHGFTLTRFGVEHRSPTNRTEAEYELGALIADTDILRGGSEDFERSGESSECSEDAAGPLLARKAMAKTNAPWFAFDLNAQLSAGTRGCPG